MRKYLKKINLILIGILSLLFFTCNTPEYKKQKQISTTTFKENQSKNTAISLEYYSENITKKVNHKLDSLLKRINKRHDFHGAILVAKNKKIVYRNQIGYADFRKK
ncbi:hypothetical protein [Polaribacter sp. Z022]|uniref:hypothetical protein n=1 Tax=Polaribacter sp. Z022 TaxID=2927125 RepID=UPI002021ABBE|nr:hypothetical protein [Polaribacter sp. Z022]MCL7754253.1 hypothetical protein [Polaribacter sp. Z022]